MFAQNICRSFSILVIAFVAFGCHSATTPPDPVVVHDPGEFGYTYNGTAIDRKDFWSGTSSGSAAYTANYGIAGSYMLDITLTVYPASSPTVRKVELLIPMPAPMTGTWTLLASGDRTKASITLKLDTASFGSKAGGTIVITKFDTVNNVVSGTFSFDGAHGTDLEHVTSGYFNETPIYFGTFNQGLVTADLNGDTFTSALTTPSPSVYSVDSGQHLVVMASSDDATTSRNLGFGITSPGVGTFDLNTSTGGQWFGTYASAGAHHASISTTTGAVGRITITKFDWMTHRMSATFYINGHDANSGAPVDVTSGKIDNVQWFLL